MMRTKVFLIFALSCVLVSTAAYAQSSPYDAIKCTKVIDGDTITLENGETVRYAGIDTPEMSKRTKAGWVSDPQPFAPEAAELNRKLTENKLVRLEFDAQKKDKYGRLLAYCFVGDTFVNAKLVEEGLAILYTAPPNVKYADLFVSLQKKARENKKGIWHEEKTITTKEANKYIGRIKTVEGKILAVNDSKKVIYLNFGKNYKTDFTAVIFKNDLSMFTKEGINPKKAYKDKCVRVTGLIKEYNGPEIIVRHPSAIEVMDNVYKCKGN
ncbi:MAG: thermonuclease family protein [Candidatus Omnitrophota bacterium]